MSFGDAASGGGSREHDTGHSERSFDEVKALVRGRILDVCRHLLPGGHVAGGEYVCASVDGGRGRSFSVNLTEGHFRDFAGGPSGADVINLWAAVKRIGQLEARREIESWLGLQSGGERVVVARTPNPMLAGSTPATFANPSEDEDPTWYRQATPERKWEYRDASGNLWAIVYRFRHPVTGKKVVRPWNPDRHVWEAPDGQRPFYNLAKIRQTDTVVLVEGEKCADAIEAVGYVATTIMGGAVASAKTDWSPLAGKNVVVWRDNDAAGLEWETRVLDELRKANALAVRLVDIPPGVPAKWDAADADETVRKNVIWAALQGRPVVSGRPVLLITDWTTDRYMEAPKPRTFLVNEVFPLGAYSVVAAEGDTGKGMMLVDLALKVAGGQPHIVNHPMSFGCSVSRFGRAVIFSAEDSWEELLRRVAVLDPDKKLRYCAKDRLMLVPLPDMGGVQPLVQRTAKGIDVTDEFARIRDQVTALDDLALVVFDPMVSFVQADLNKDSAAAAFVSAQFAQLAAATGASVIAANHMAKLSFKEAVRTPEQARKLIRGTSAIVDGARAAYALWREEEGESKRILKALEEPTDGDRWRNRVVKGALVKSNGPGDRTVRTYIRDLATGLLIDRTAPVGQIVHQQDDELAYLLVRSVQMAAEKGFPFQLSGGSGIFEKRERLHPLLLKNKVSRDKLRALASAALAAKQIVHCRHSGTADKWLDVPDGPFSRGMGQMEIGSGEPGKWWADDGAPL